MARRHHRRSEENPEWGGVVQSGGDPKKCAFYFYNGSDMSQSVVFKCNTGNPTITTILETSFDGETWSAILASSAWYSTTPSVNIPAGGYLYIRNTSETPVAFNTEGEYKVFKTGRATDMNIGGNIKSLLCKHWNKNIPLTSYCFANLFNSDPSDTGSGSMYSFLSLIQWTAGSSDPDHVDFVMPFNTLAPFCYYHMFYKSQYSLFSNLPYNGNGDASIKSNVLVLQGDMSNAPGCFAGMFEDSLHFSAGGDWIDMSEISGIMPGGAFQSMFAGCTQLVYANHVIYGLDWYFGGGGIAGGGMMNMFKDCTSLQEFVFSSWGNPVGGFTYKGVHYAGTQDQIDDVFMDIFESRVCAGVARDSFSDIAAMQSMFSGCSSLLEAWLPPYCRVGPQAYSGMYQNCGLIRLGYFHGNPILPAGIPYSSGSHTEYNPLSEYCYASMFSGCPNLREAPILPAETLAANCYRSMFALCNNIHYIKMLAIITDDSYTYQWLYGCEKTYPSAILVVAGTSAGANSWDSSVVSGISGVPNGWTVYNTYTEPLWFKNIGNGSATLSLTKASSAPNINVCWFTDTNQSSITPQTISASTTLLTVGPCVRIFIQCPTGYSNARLATGTSSYWRFTSTTGSGTQWAVGGQISTLLRPTGLADSNSTFDAAYTFYRTFYNMTTLKYAQELNINNYRTLTGGGLGNYTYVYRELFRGCTILKYPPAHLGGTLYSSGTSARYQLYQSFYECTDLRESPILAPITVNRLNYYRLFYCTSAGSLKKVTALFTNTPGDSTASPHNYGTYQWLYNQNQEGIFYKASSATWTDVGDYAVPASFDIDTNTYRNQFVNHHPNWIYYLVEKKFNSDPE